MSAPIAAQAAPAETQTNPRRRHARRETERKPGAAAGMRRSKHEATAGDKRTLTLALSRKAGEGIGTSPSARRPKAACPHPNPPNPLPARVARKRLALTLTLSRKAGEGI